MSTIVGLVVVFAAVLGGFAMVGGPFPVLFQPSEIVVIGGLMQLLRNSSQPMGTPEQLERAKQRNRELEEKERLERDD